MLENRGGYGARGLDWLGLANECALASGSPLPVFSYSLPDQCMVSTP